MGGLRAAAVGVLFFLIQGGPVWGGPVYVFREADGTVHFTSFPPPKGVTAKVFTAENSKFSYYVGRWEPGLRGKNGGRLFGASFNGIIAESAKRHGLSESLLRAVIHVESAFNPHAVSPKGALGLMQLLPENARRLGVRNPFCPHENIHAGSRWLASLLKRYGGDLKLALAAYNAGIAAVS